MTHESEARALIALYHDRVTETRLFAESGYPGFASRLSNAAADLEVASEAFRAKHYPNAAEVFVAGHTVLMRDAEGLVPLLDLFDEYKPGAK